MTNIAFAAPVGELLTDAALKAAVEHAQTRGAANAEIKDVVRRVCPVGKVYDCLTEQRPAVIAALDGLGCPAQFFPIAKRLIETAVGHGGKFVFAGFGEDPATGDNLPATIEHVPNSGDGKFLIRAVGVAIHRIAATPGMNVYVTPALMRDDLPQGSRGKESDVIGVLAIVLDFDGKHDPATRHERLPLAPQAEVETSPGNVQSWSFLDKPYPVAEVKPLIAALVDSVGADPGCKSCDHPFRVPGTKNWPSQKKIARGRSPEPVAANLIQAPEDWHANISLDEVRDAVLKKYPDAFDAQGAKLAGASEIDWDKAATPAGRNPLSDDETARALNDPQYIDDRSEGVWAFINHALRRGHTPNETVQLMLDHSDTLLMGHYRGRVEEDVRADVGRAVAKMPPPPLAREVFSDAVLPAARIATGVPGREIDKTPSFPDLSQHGFPRSTTANTRLAIQALALDCRYDVFHDRMIVEGHSVVEWATGELSDNLSLRLREFITLAYQFEPKKEAMNDALKQVCLQHCFNPVLDYLDALRWDGSERIDTWLIDHGGAPDTPYVRAVSRLMLIAAVRRIRRPGCKFDEIIVLEGPEGRNKSSLIELMAGRENFSDQSILHIDDRKQQEHMRGKWLYEVADLTGISRTQRDKIKADASRTVDRARAAYAAYERDQPRTCIWIATTNDSDYLEGDTGHRRWWPVQITKHIDLAAVAAVREQLWAEAAHKEATGVSIRLPAELWEAAATEQEERRLADPWEDILADVKGEAHLDPEGRSDWHEQRIHSTTLMTNRLRLDPVQQTAAHGKRVKRIMSRLGWDHHKNLKISGDQGKGFSRLVNEPLPSRGQEQASNDGNSEF